MHNKGKWDWHCIDCGMDTSGFIDHQSRAPSEYYLLHDELWEEIVSESNRSRMLCIGCVENRLGRKLTKNDFDPGKNNDGGINSLDDHVLDPRSERLIDRLTRE